MSKRSFIDSFEVGTPCSEDWEKMHGNDRVRFCDHCAKDVKNLSAITRKEAVRLVRLSGGGICIRYIKDPTTNRPIFAGQLLQITRRAPSVAAGVMSASIALSTAAYAQGGSQIDPPVIRTTVEKTEKVSDEPVVETTISPGKIETLPKYEAMGAIAFSTVLKFDNPLTQAVQNEDIDEVRDLIAHGANVNGKEGNKTTPLFVAVENGNVEIARLLLDFGAKVNARDADKQTPLMRIDEDATVELIDLLTANGAKIDLTDKEGNTALILAAGNIKPDVLQKLIDAGADVNAANKQGQTALMNAADVNGLENVRSLLIAGAKVNVKNKEGDTAWDLATDDEVEALLVSFGAEVPIDDAETESTTDN
jgi:hypothetical protein